MSIACAFIDSIPHNKKHRFKTLNKARDHIQMHRLNNTLVINPVPTNIIYLSKNNPYYYAIANSYENKIYKLYILVNSLDIYIQSL